MNLKMKTLAAAMIAAGTLGTAQASQILFPYVVNSQTVTTVVSVINQSASNSLHYVLRSKSGPAVANDDNSATCTEFDAYLPTSHMDIQTVDLAAHFGATTKGVLFNDPSINNKWVQTNKDFAIIKTALGGVNATPLRGYLVVDTNGTETAQMIEGEAMVYEFASGATWGYTAGRAVDGNFALDADITATSGQSVSIKPWGETTTKFLVTPIVPQMISGNNTASTTIRLNNGVLPIGVAMYDRDENPFSGTIDQTVVCVGSVNAEKLVSVGVKTSTPDGGWGVLQITNKTPASAASVIKLDYNSKATFNGEAVTGTFNNAFQLR